MYTHPCHSLELTARTCTCTPQASIRDPSRLWPPTSNHHRHQHSNGGGPQHHARDQQPPGHDQVKTTKRHHHRRLPDRCLSRPATELHHIVDSKHHHPYYYSVRERFFSSVCTYTNDPCTRFVYSSGLVTHVRHNMRYPADASLVLITLRPPRRRSPNRSGTF